MKEDPSGLIPSPEYLHHLVGIFQREMDRGLSAEPSSLKMLPAYIHFVNPPSEQSAVAIDVGGSNLRTGLVTTDQEGKLSLTEMKSCRLPAADRPVESGDFFVSIAREILEIVHDTGNIGFCFSYPMEHLFDGDARAIGLTKEIRINNLVGRRVGRALHKSLIQLGGPSMITRRITVLNDTVATLLAGMACDETQPEGSEDLGLIVGTGTNMAYNEDNRRIGKIPLSSGRQIINTESGGFDKIDQSDIDKTVDRTTENPGKQPFEKMVAGRYLANTIWESLRAAAHDKKLSNTLSNLVQSSPPPPLQEISEWRRNKEDAGSGLGRKLKELKVPRGDISRLLQAIDDVITRSAILAAVPCAAVVMRGKQKGETRAARIFWEGSVMENFPGYRDIFSSTLSNLLIQHGEYELSLKQIPHSSLLGSGVAALIQRASSAAPI
jgi:hexokinase